MKRSLARPLACLAALLLPWTTTACAAERAPIGAAKARYLDWDGAAEVRLLPRGRSRGWLIGGLSGLAWDGREGRLLAVGDRGQVFQVPVTPDDAPAHLARLSAPRRMRDAEAIRYAPEHGWHVAFEDENAIAFYPGDAKAMENSPKRVIYLGDKRDHARNQGVEALVLTDFGRLIAFVEGKGEGAQKVWLIDGEDVSETTYAATDGFSPVDAVAAPNGDVLVLERRFNGLPPPIFSSRLARVPAMAVAAGGPLTPVARFDLASVLPSENWEGIEIVEAPGGPNLWIVSDDNMQWPQNTLLARYPLEQALANLK